MVNLSDLSTVKNTDDLIEAVETTFDPELNLSKSGRAKLHIKLKEIAKYYDCLSDICCIIEDYTQRFEAEESQKCFVTDVAAMCSINNRGKIETTIRNFRTILENDPEYSTVRKSELSANAEYIDKNGKKKSWSDDEMSEAKEYIEDNYRIHSEAKLWDAFAIFVAKRTYNPVKEIIESTKWDGVDRIESTLSKWLAVEDNEYTREVSRLIFAGGINRLYNPGCKFDEMAVLVGGQGAGKSTFVRFLAMDDEFFSELTTMDGKEGIEAIDGSWIVEVSELLALTKAKERETAKSYISRQYDKFRPAYGHFVEKRPRTCIFVGTTNYDQFITDKTGGRRFYPVYCNSSGTWLNEHREECLEYIRQCWAEALAKINTDFMATYARPNLMPLIKEAQKNATEDDWRTEVIQAYLEKHQNDLICARTLWEEALELGNKELSKADQMLISQIMKNFPDWHKTQRTTRTKYGCTSSWKYLGKPKQLTYTTPNDYTPFDS